MKYRKRQRLRTATHSGCPKCAGDWIMKAGKTTCRDCGTLYVSPQPKEQTDAKAATDA
jgi:hypothetical protein